MDHARSPRVSKRSRTNFCKLTGISRAVLFTEVWPGGEHRHSEVHGRGCREPFGLATRALWDDLPAKSRAQPAGRARLRRLRRGQTRLAFIQVTEYGVRYNGRLTALLRAPIPVRRQVSTRGPKFARGGGSLACLWAYQSGTAPRLPPRLLTLSFLLPSHLWPYSLPISPTLWRAAPVAPCTLLRLTLYTPSLYLPSLANTAFPLFLPTSSITMVYSILPNSSTVVITLGIAALLYIVRWLADKGRYDLKRIPSAVSTSPLDSFTKPTAADRADLAPLTLSMPVRLPPKPSTLLPFDHKPHPATLGGHPRGRSLARRRTGSGATSFALSMGRQPKCTPGGPRAPGLYSASAARSSTPTS